MREPLALAYRRGLPDWEGVVTDLPSRASKVNGEAVESQYREGYHLRVIAEQHGVSKELIRKILIARGVPMRGRGGNQGLHSRHRK